MKTYYVHCRERGVSVGVVPSDDGTALTFAAAIVGRRDQFCRWRARKIIDGRLAAGRHSSFYVQIRVRTETTVEDVIRSLHVELRFIAARRCAGARWASTLEAIERSVSHPTPRPPKREEVFP